MRLYESLEEEFLEQMRVVYQAYEALEDKVSMLDTICEENNNIKIESGILKDFCSHELNDKIKNTIDSFLDEYYPINYGDDEEDQDRARDIYRTSLESRKEIEDQIYSN